jgi:tropomyosin-1
VQFDTKEKRFAMTTNLQQGTLLDVLKKKMRQTKEEMERYKDECEEFNRKYQLEAMRREEVRTTYSYWLE